MDRSGSTATEAYKFQARHWTVVACSWLVATAFTGAAWSADPDTGKSFLKLSLEELGNIEITSVSRHAEKLTDAPASIYVITGEDIRRSGVTSLPEALRLAPNLQVARINTGAYAISARGFNNGIGNKLLVLIDGRAVYTSLFSTVNWDSHYVVLDDVERIEVISGPGATLWGANAVNGVINITTRTAKDTQGGLVSAGGGNDETGATARYGGTFGSDGYYRAYGTGFTRQNSVRSNGSIVADGWENGQGGFRADWGGEARNFTVQGDAYRGRSDPGTFGPTNLAGSNLLARWNEKLSPTSNYHFQVYYDTAERDDPVQYRDEAKTIDIEFQHASTLTEAQKILWGGGYRHARDETQTKASAVNPVRFELIPAERSLEWSNLFIQDEISLSRDVTATLGLKAEKNDYTGTEYLPSARLAWKLSEEQLLWSAISRAVRAPARIDREFFLSIFSPSVFPIILGGPDFQSEVVNTAEIGYRTQASPKLFYSITTYYSVYDKLRSGQPRPAVVQNMIEGTTYGAEAWGSYQVTPDWRLSAGLTELVKHLKLKPGSLDPDGPKKQGNDPESTWQLRSAWDLTERYQLDLIVRHVSALPDPQVPSYTALDGNFTWHAKPGVDVSFAVQNIFGRPHPEFQRDAPETEATRSVFDRSVFLKVTWRL